MVRHVPIRRARAAGRAPPIRPGLPSCCTRRTRRAGTRWRPSPSARRRGSRRRPASRGGSSRPARSARPASGGARPGSGPRPTRSPRGRRSAGSSPRRCSSATRSGSTSITWTVPSAAMEWVNWSGSQRAQPGALRACRARAPSSRRRSSTGPAPVRVAGAGHSFSAGAVTEGTLISLDALDRVLDADAATGLVRVEAGIRLQALSRELHARGLAMPNLGDIDAQSLAGALSTGTHGTGTRLPNLSGQVEAVELVLADGSERTIERRRRAARRARLARRARRDRRGHAALRAGVPAAQPRPAGAARGRAEHAAGARRRPRPLRVLDLPARGRRAHAHARAAPRTRRPAPGRARTYTSDILLDNHAFRAVNEVARRFPRTIPRLNRFASAVASQRERVDWSYAIFASPRLVRFEEMEYARAARARRRRPCAPRARCSSATRCRSRSSCASRAGDDALLSPAHGRDSAFVAVHVFRAWRTSRPFREVEAALSALGGRPHWGKRSFLRAAELAPRYPRWDDFQALRARARPGRALRQRVGAPRAGMSAMKTFNIFDADVRVRPRGPGGLPRRAWTASDRRSAPAEIGARSTSCRPARRCARTTTSPTRSGCIVLEGQLTVRHPDGDGRARPGRPHRVPGRPGGRAQDHQRLRASPSASSCSRPRPSPAVAVLPGLATRSASGPATATSTRHGPASGERRSDYYDGEASP